ncbi:alpha-ribazole phosphatase CobZ [Methanimicrococcus blatticola]|uniref:Alpha-ribazole phosphatase CobZ n=1 Tax=Methanimicrococcus blatticola TaxID=91560 RepID=A0A484F648_9EURY|nr:alpha-ribazole phosphatase CobZ [Methanimicrococcus blatticola]MBZ3935847.1 alpha-ribazole phosphatase CobZ [Methanimicrococcus blatticola]MCC2508032.1 alpha-ribazole phosphatase CobZ [Methanimicrococcus blatticola]TDQ68885.1 alpha-ribazole phosphatase CobZ [Methanimicrococcus blatticola]
MKLSNMDDGFKKEQPNVIEEETSKTIMDVLKGFGISYADLENTAMEFYVPHPGIETEEKARAYFKREFDYAIGDSNLQLLIYTALLLEKEGKEGTLPGLSKKSYEQDLSFIIADEILGEAVAGYIGGTKGKFEFVRFDKNKPGIIKELGMFMDDIIGGLLGGVSANMYSRAMSELSEEKK